MIKKFLIAGKQVYFSSTNPDPHLESSLAMEIEMPIEAYWEAKEHLKTSEYLQASGQPPAEISAAIISVYRICSKYAVHEKDRVWLLDKVNAG